MTERTETPERIRVIEADALDALRAMPDESFHAVVTDPPYGLSEPPDLAEVLTEWLAGRPYLGKKSGFMSATWDSFVPGPELWREVYRVLKPGGILLAFAATRTDHFMGTAIALAGFKKIDTIAWLNGQGWPKGGDLGKAIDRQAGNARVITSSRTERPRAGNTDFCARAREIRTTSLPATEESARWTGWSTAIKPANEPIGVYRKPPRGTIVANLRQHGTGAFHVSACLIGDSKRVPGGKPSANRGDRCHGEIGEADPENDQGWDPNVGRWPPDVMLTHSPECDPTACVEWCPVALLDAQSGIRKSGAMRKASRGAADDARARAGGFAGTPEDDGLIVASEGGASRFFWVGPHAEEADLDGFKYAAKAHPSDRDDGLPADVHNTHPTVKPLPVARWLARLVGTDDGVILDCFSGSGTTARACLLEGFACVAIERDPEYAELSRLRAGLAPTEALGWIRLRDRLREAAVPRKRSAKARPTRPETPGVALIKAWGAEGRAACVAWLDATGGDARVAPVPSHMSEWSDSFTPPAGHPSVAPAPARAVLPPRKVDVLAELREAHAVEALISDATDAAPEPVELTIAAVPDHLGAAPGPANAAPEIPTDIARDGADLFAAPESPPPAIAPPAKARRKRRDAALRAAVAAATIAGDPESPDGADLLPDAPGREAEVLAEAAFGPRTRTLAEVEAGAERAAAGRPDPGAEVAAARARGEAALRAMPPMVQRLVAAVERETGATASPEAVRVIEQVAAAEVAARAGLEALLADLTAATEAAAPIFREATGEQRERILEVLGERDPWDDLPPMFAPLPRRA